MKKHMFFYCHNPIGLHCTCIFGTQPFLLLVGSQKRSHLGAHRWYNYIPCHNPWTIFFFVPVHARWSCVGRDYTLTYYRVETLSKRSFRDCGIHCSCHTFPIQDVCVPTSSSQVLNSFLTGDNWVMNHKHYCTLAMHGWAGEQMNFRARAL